MTLYRIRVTRMVGGVSEESWVTEKDERCPRPGSLYARTYALFKMRFILEGEEVNPTGLVSMELRAWT